LQRNGFVAVDGDGVSEAARDASARETVRTIGDPAGMTFMRISSTVGGSAIRPLAY
jgi:hypothetical protein